MITTRSANEHRFGQWTMNNTPSNRLSPAELRAIVETRLPAWLGACASETDIIVLHEAAFDTSKGELFLFALCHQVRHTTRQDRSCHLRWTRREELTGSHPASTRVPRKERLA